MVLLKIPTSVTCFLHSPGIEVVGDILINSRQKYSQWEDEPRSEVNAVPLKTSELESCWLLFKLAVIGKCKQN